ncbi:MAG: NAD(P)H-dependent flavin oxidoreductase [Flavobacteriales bacterium]
MVVQKTQPHVRVARFVPAHAAVVVQAAAKQPVFLFEGGVIPAFFVFTLKKHCILELMSTSVSLSQLLGIQHPIIVAPMFLVSNAAMIKAALDAGATGAIPALNYRTDEELRAAITEIKNHSDKPFGINLIVNKSNPKLKAQLKTVCDLRVGFVITSLGSPEETIKACKPLGIKVFCDVTDVAYARKVEALGADAVIAVNSQAGGHAGKLSAEELIPALKKECSIPIISAGGVATRQQLDHVTQLGASGVSVGTIFIATHEAPVSNEYKNAMVTYGAKDIVMTTKLSGTPCTVINTDYVKQIGTKQNWFEKMLSKNKRLKKFMKLFTFYRGMKKLQKAAFSATYQTVWCAGPAIEYVDKIRSVKEIIDELTNTK